MARDLVQELVRRNAELTAQVSDLTRALAQGEAISQLVAGVVHDFRNALHVMLLEAESLAGSLLDPSQVASAEQVLAAGNHAAAIARDLLALARRESRSSLINSAQLLDGFQRLIQRLVSPQLDCRFEVEPDAWPIEIEHQQLEAALINLTINARDAMPHGGLLRVAARNLARDTVALPPELPAGDYVCFSVEDSGIGMSELVLARATEAFFTTKEANRGTGLGLSMVQAFASRSGGALKIESEPDRGTRVQILLPRAGCAAATDPADDDKKLTLLARRMRSSSLQSALRGWRAACPKDGLPQPAIAEASVIDQAESSLVLGVEQECTPPALRVIRVGNTLMRALGRSALGELPLDDSVILGSLGAAYRRALRSRAPSYEYVRYSFGEGSPVAFERLILPAASDGKTVSHLIGVIELCGDFAVGS